MWEELGRIVHQSSGGNAFCIYDDVEGWDEGMEKVGARNIQAGIFINML